MNRQMIAAAGALTVLLASPFAAHARADADGGDKTILTLQGTLRCLLSANNVPRGGGPMVVCQQANGQAIGTAPWSTGKYPVRLSAALMRGTGEFYWTDNGVPAPGESGGDAVVGPGSTYHVNGWTIKDEGLRARISYDATGHGYFINAIEERGF